MGFHDFSATRNDGRTQALAEYRGKVVLVVNTASRCGFTSQYKGLQALHESHGPRGLEILAFPCDQFGRQEPGADAEIAGFCARNFGVSFPLFAKIEVNGARAHPLYAWLRSQQGGLLTDAIKWNFTKFLLDREGRVRGRFAPTTTPAALTKEVEALLREVSLRG